MRKECALCIQAFYPAVLSTFSTSDGVGHDPIAAAADAKLVYNGRMPVPPLVSALISSVINSVVDSAMRPSELLLQESAMLRQFPAETRRGEMEPPNMQGEVVIGGQTLYLAPGVQIRNIDNRIVTPSSVQEPATVRYLTDASGAIFRVWVLTPAEAAAPEASP